jgi:hypothetical protein
VPSTLHGDPAELALAVIPGQTKRCTKCGRVKVLACFWRSRQGRHVAASCKACERRRNYEYSHSEQGKAARAKYNASPIGQESRSRIERKRAAWLKDYLKRYQASAWGKLIRGRGTARYRLRRTIDLQRRAALEALVAAYDREIERIKRELA